MRPTGLLLLAAALTLGVAVAEEVVLDYRAEVTTVTGTPFNLDVPLTTEVIGVFVYDTATGTDSNPGNTQRGVYHLTSGGAFEARFLDHRITGSTTPELQVEDIQVGGGNTIDTFRFIDGDRLINPPGVMSIDSTPDAEIELGLSITDGSGAAFTDDLLPAIFPLPMRTGGAYYNHTFTLRDDDGTMSLQFDWLLQRIPNVPKIIDVQLDGEEPRLLFHSKPDKTYSIEFSTDLKNWEVIDPDHPADGYLTDYVDTGLVARMGGFPENAYYRLSENAPAG